MIPEGQMANILKEASLIRKYLYFSVGILTSETVLNGKDYSLLRIRVIRWKEH